MNASASSRPLVASDVMSSHPICIAADANLAEAAEVFDANEISGAPVIDAEDRVIGVISKTDLLHRLLEGSADEPGRMSFSDYFGLARGSGSSLDLDDLGVVGDVMTPDPVLAQRTTPMREIAERMVAERVHRIVVVDEKQHAVGVVTTLDLLDAFSSD